MQNNYLALIVLGIGFLAYFLIIIYGPYLFDLIFYPDDREIKDNKSL